MEQALGLKELCEKNLSAGLRLVASLTAYVPVEVFLYLAFSGAVLHVFLSIYALYALVRCLTRRARTRYAAANNTRVPTVSPAPERSAGSPVVAPRPASPGDFVTEGGGTGTTRATRALRAHSTLRCLGILSAEPLDSTRYSPRPCVAPTTHCP